MLPIIIIAIAVGIGFLVFGTFVAFLTGILVGVEFLVVTFLILYALYKLDMIDDSYKWTLVVAPFGMFFVGLLLDKAHVLSIQPLSLSTLLSNPLSVSAETFLLVILVILGIVNIYVEVTEK